jgi:hypothetical protein
MAWLGCEKNLYTCSKSSKIVEFEDDEISDCRDDDDLRPFCRVNSKYPVHRVVQDLTFRSMPAAVLLVAMDTRVEIQLWPGDGVPVDGGELPFARLRNRNANRDLKGAGGAGAVDVESTEEACPSSCCAVDVSSRGSLAAFDTAASIFLPENPRAM